jgi:hypothetical protein
VTLGFARPHVGKGRIGGGWGDVVRIAISQATFDAIASTLAIS